MIPATYDFSVVRGTAGPTQGLKFRLKAKNGETLENIPFEDVRLSIYQRKTLLLRATLQNGKLAISDPSQAEILWSPNTVDTRLIPVGAKATYELEVWNGETEIVYMMGTITGIGGINDDQDGTNSEDDPS